MKVLLADDDADICEVTAHFLTRRGWVVTTVPTAREAAVALAEEDFDVAVLDENMPPGSGLQVAAERRRLGDQIPIVLWTGWSGTLDGEEVERLDVHVLNKADVRKLSSLVEELADPSSRDAR